jgi:O-antigen/teichoic acid export membrane protein
MRMRGRRSADVTEPRRRDSLVSGSAALLSGRLVVAALGWASTILIVRSLTPAEWGQFTFVFGLLFLISALTDLGVGRIAISGVVEDAPDRVGFAGAYIGLRALLGVGGYALAVLAVWAGGYPADVVAGTAIAGLVLVLATIAHAVDVVFQATERLHHAAVAQVLGQLTLVPLVAAIAASGGSLLAFMLPAVAFEVVALGYRVTRLPRDFRPRPHVDVHLWRRLLREAAPLAAGVILATALTRIDVVMLSQLDTFAALGVYGVAIKFGDLVHFASSAVTTAALPLLVRAWPADAEAFRATFRRAVLLLSLAGALVAVEFALFAEPVLTLLYGERYAEGDLATQLVVAGEVVGYASALALAALVAVGRNRLYPVAMLVGVGANVALNFWLIPAYSYEGAAIATLAAEGTVAVLLVAVALRLRVTGGLPLGMLARVVLAATVAVAVGAAAEALLPWVLAGALTAGAFVGAAYAARVPGLPSAARWRLL